MKQPRGRVTFSTSTVAPTGGLNTRDPVASRGEQFADNLTNWVATPNGVAARKGYKKHSTGIDGSVETLMPYNSGNTSQSRMFAAYGNGTTFGIADVSTNGPALIAGADAQVGLSNSKFSHVNFTGAAGHYLVVCNGANPARHWNGMAWVPWTIVATPAAPGEISGVDPMKFSAVTSHQKRLWFVERDSTKAWYMPINSLGGAAVFFDFGALFQRGGKLVALTSWSMNGGTGMQNMLVAISSTGDTVIYEGTDPSDSTKWKINGTWKLGKPVGNQCFMQFGGDTLLLSQDGLVPLSKFMQATTTSAALSDTIRNTITDVLASQNGLPGFQLHDYLTENLLILNVPQINQNNNVQFIFHTITGGWSVFAGMPATCWGSLGDQIFFGGYQNVFQAFVGYRDNAEVDGSGGDSYVATGQQSQNYFDKPGQKKQFVRARVNIQTASGAPNIRLGCNVDYDTTPPENTGALLTTSPNAWGSALWGISKWGNSDLQNYNEWQILGPVGTSGAIVIAVSVQAETLWISTDWEIQLCSSR